MRVQFEAVTVDGDAVGRDEHGRVIFVARGAPGDVAAVAVDEQHKRYARGHIIAIERASEVRIVPPCPFYKGAASDLSIGERVGPDVAGDVCGGCQLQHLEYAAQLAAKRDIVYDALQRIGGIGARNGGANDGDLDSIVRACVASPLPFNYRNKADLVVALKDGKTRIGFFTPNSHRVVDVTHCPIQQQPNNELLAAARACVAEELVTPFEAATGKGILRRLVARTSSTGETLLTAVTTRAPWSQAQAFASRMRAAVPSLAGVLRREPHREAYVLEGRDWLEENVNGLRLRVTGEGFFQINSALTPALVETAMRLAAVQPGHHALDLFSGVGLFTLAMARLGAHVTGVEENRAAVRDAKGNAGRNDLRADFIAGDACRVLRRLPSRPQGKEWDVVLLDPPRAGAHACMSDLVNLRPRRIVYVSCNPATLARDVKALTAHGYCLKEAVPLDLFPQTAHVETVAKLERTEA